MKKLFVTALIAAMAFSTAAQAELEIGGNVTTVTGFTYTNDANAIGGGQAGQGDLGFSHGTGTEFGFVLDQVELDLESEFGHNIRARADIDFRDTTGGSQVRVGDTVTIEQAYVTANLGDSVEFAVGKMNAPVGLESNDRVENAFSAYTPAYTYLNPKSVMGLKFYYEFSDTWSLDFAIVNSLNGTGSGAANTGIAGASKATDIPSAILRIGAVWGEEGRESFANLAFGFGPENASNKYDLYGNLWGNWAFGDYWDLAWEIVYYNSDSATGTNPQALAVQLAAIWQASEAWDVQLRANWFGELKSATGVTSTNGTAAFSGLGAKGNLFGGALGATYHVTEDANIKIEYHFDYAKITGGAKEDYHAVLAEFGYSF
jgi:hypothetical protein